MAADNVDGGEQWYQWGLWVAIVDKESSSKRWGPLDICVDVDTIVERQKRYQCKCRVVPLDNYVDIDINIELLSLDNYINTDVNAEWCYSTSISMTLSSLNNYVCIDVDVKRPLPLIVTLLIHNSYIQPSMVSPSTTNDDIHHHQLGY